MFAVDLTDLLTIRCEQRHRHIYPSLVDHHVQVLAGDHRDLVGMRLTTRELSLNGFTRFQRVTLLSALRRAANQCVFRRDCMLEAMRTQVARKNLTDTRSRIEDRGSNG